MKRHFVVTGLFVLAILTLTSSPAFADLILNISGSGTIVGPANTLVTIHDNQAAETGCITLLSSCLNNATTHVAGGDNIGLNTLLTLSTDESFAAIVNSKYSAANSTETLTDLYLTFNGLNGSYTAEYLGADIVLSEGSAIFNLTSDDFTAIQSLGSSVTVGGGMSFAVGSTTGGPETLYVVHFPSVTNGPGGSDGTALQAVAVPEPGTLLFMTTGLAAVLLKTRWRQRSLNTKLMLVAPPVITD